MSSQHRIDITVELSSGVHLARLQGTPAEFAGQSEEEAVGLLLAWLSEQFIARTRAVSHSSGGGSVRLREEISVQYRMAPDYSREESEVLYNMRPDFGDRRK